MWFNSAAGSLNGLNFDADSPQFLSRHLVFIGYQSRRRENHTGHPLKVSRFKIRQVKVRFNGPLTGSIKIGRESTGLKK